MQLGASGCCHPLLLRPLKVSSPKGKECTRPFARGSCSCLGCQVPTLPLPGKLSSHTLHLDSPPQHLSYSTPLTSGLLLALHLPVHQPESFLCTSLCFCTSSAPSEAQHVVGLYTPGNGRQPSKDLPRAWYKVPDRLTRKSYKVCDQSIVTICTRIHHFIGEIISLLFFRLSRETINFNKFPTRLTAFSEVPNTSCISANTIVPQCP